MDFSIEGYNFDFMKDVFDYIGSIRDTSESKLFATLRR